MLHQEVGASLYRLRAMLGKIEVGKLTALMQQESVVLLSDVVVENDVVTLRIPFRRLFTKRWPRIGMTSFRGHGIGTSMVEHFLDWCRTNGKNEAYGTVVQKDLDETPGLLDWYQRHGFEIRTPDDRCLGNAVCMVVWKNENPYPSGGGEL